jgi:hypothetical protein
MALNSFYIKLDRTSLAVDNQAPSDRFTNYVKANGPRRDEACEVTAEGPLAELVKSVYKSIRNIFSELS